MAVEFDAYQELLGIPPERHPPNYYDLVGVELFESEADVIAESADQQVAKLKDCAAAVSDEAIVDRLLERIETARACLLDQTKKRPYDEKLRSRQRTRGEATSVSAAPPPAPLTKSVDRERDMKNASLKSKSKPARSPIFVLAIVAIVGFAGLITGGVFVAKKLFVDSASPGLIAELSGDYRLQLNYVWRTADDKLEHTVSTTTIAPCLSARHNKTGWEVSFGERKWVGQTPVLQQLKLEMPMSLVANLFPDAKDTPGLIPQAEEKSTLTITFDMNVFTANIVGAQRHVSSRITQDPNSIPSGTPVVVNEHESTGGFGGGFGRTYEIPGRAGFSGLRVTLTKVGPNTKSVAPPQIVTKEPLTPKMKISDPDPPFGSSGPSFASGMKSFGSGMNARSASKSGKPLAIVAVHPAKPIEGHDWQVYFEVGDSVARVVYRTRPDDSWTPVEIPTRSSSPGFGGATSGAQQTDHRPPSVGPNQPVIRLTKLVAGELKLEVQAFDKDDKELLRIEPVYAVETNPWKDFRHVAVLSHGGLVERVRFFPLGKLLVHVRPIEIAARPENAEDAKSLATAQLVAQRSGGFDPLTQCVLWNPEGWKMESATAVFGLLATGVEESGTLLLARSQRQPGTEPIQERILWVKGASTSTLVENSVDLDAVEVAPGGAIVAVASRESVRMLNASNGELLHTFELGNLTAPPRRRGFANPRSGGRTGAFSSQFETMVEIGGAKMESVLRSLTFSDDGKLLVLTDDQNQQVIVWDWPERKRLQTLTAMPQSLAIHSTTFTLAMGVSNTLQLRDIATAAAKTVWELPFNASALAFHPLGECLAVGVQNKVVLLRTKDGYPLRELTGHDGNVSTLAFSSDGAWLVSGATDKTVRVWRSTTEATPPLSQTAPKLIASHLLYIDQLITQQKLGAALDVMPLVFQTNNAAPGTVTADLDSGRMVPLPGASPSSKKSRSGGATQKRQTNQFNSPIAESFARWIKEGRYKTMQERLDLVVKDQLDKDLQARFDQITKSLAETMRQEADAALKSAAQQTGKEKLQAEFAVFRDFPSALLPKSFADDQQRSQTARRDSARRLLQKLSVSDRASAKLKSEDRNALERIANLEFFLPEEAASAKRLLGTK